MSAPSPRSAVEVQLPAGPVVILVLLTPHEIMDAMKAAGDSAVAVRGLSVSREALRRSVRKVGDKAVTYLDLVSGWKKHFPRTRHTMQLAGVWLGQHMPSEAEAKAFRASMTPTDEGDREVWTATLPDGRTIRMAEQDEETIEDVLASIKESGPAAELRSQIEAGRRCLLEPHGSDLDSDKKWDAAFSMKDTALIGLLWREIHLGSGDEEPVVGEVNGACGT